MSEKEEKGFVKIKRTDFSDGWLWDSNEPFCKRAAWIDLVQLARFVDGTASPGGVRMILKRGEIVASLRFLLKRWKWNSMTKVDNFLKNLIEDGKIKIEIRAGISIISINEIVENSISKEAVTEQVKGIQEAVTEQKPIIQKSEKSQIIRREERENEIKEESNTTDHAPQVGSNPPVDDNYILPEELRKDYFALLIKIQNLPAVAKMKTQLHPKEYETLRATYSQEQIFEILEAMENSKSIKGKTSVYRTADNWLKRHFGNKEITDAYEKFEQRYREFIIIVTHGEVQSPRVDRFEKEALFQIMEYLKLNSKEKTMDSGFKNYDWIFANWNKLDPFMQKRIKLQEIEKDLTKIIKAIKDAQKPSNNSGGNRVPESTDISGRKDFNG